MAHLWRRRSNRVERIPVDTVQLIDIFHETGGGHMGGMGHGMMGRGMMGGGIGGRMGGEWAWAEWG